MSTPGVVVVGASAAGLATVENLRRGDYDGTLTLIGDENHLPYDRPPLSKQLLSGQWTRERIDLRTDAALAGLGVDLVLGDRATALDVPARAVTTASGRRIDADHVVVATGAHARAMPGQDQFAGVHVVRTVDDTMRLRETLRPAARLVVVGDGALGMEVAATARAIDVQVTVVGAQDVPMAAQLGPVAGGVLADLHHGHGVDLRTGVEVAGLTGTRGQVTGVELNDGEHIEADVVLVAIGAEPATGWLASSGLNLTDGLVCDARCSAADGVWAVGDVARWHHLGLGKSVRLENRTNAAEQAAAVAANILGADSPYSPVPYFWTDQFGVKILVHGVPGPADDVEVVEGDITGGRFVLSMTSQGRPTAVLGWSMPKQTRQHRARVLSTYAPEPVTSR